MRPTGLLHSAAIAFAAILLSGFPLDAAPCPEKPDVPADDRKPSESREPKKEHDRNRPTRSDGDRHRRDSSDYRSAFDNISDEERARIRAALQQVWSDPEVIAAKKNLQDSTEHYRETLRTALAKVDPEMQSILKKMMMGPHGPGGPGRGGPSPSGTRDWGDPNKPGYARSSLDRFHKEFADRMRPDMRDTLKTAHEAAVKSPKVVESLDMIEKSKDVRAKMDGIRQLREAYRNALVKEAPPLKPFVTRPFGSGMRPPGTPGSGNRPPRPPSDKAPPAEETDR